jgi:DNA-binding NtrC family response regulator
VEWSRAIRTGQRLALENEVLRRDQLPVLIAESPAMKRVIALMERIAPSDATVLVTGEHGTGKEVAARWIHAASSRKDRPLVIVNAGGLPEGVFESELFGHVKGAFTDARADRVGRFEMADGGTLFLDEIANLTLGQQARLLRVLQSGELERVGDSRTRKVDVRVIAATNADLRAEVSAGRFREDLLFRLNTIEIHLPPLHQRPEDIAPLAQYFLERYAAKYRSAARGFSPAALSILATAPWPGNVRELDHAIERATLLAQGPVIDVPDLGRGDAAAEATADRARTLDEVERDAIRAALAAHGGNVVQAAKALGLSRSALYRRLERYGL